jgi:shikimate kinase
MVPTIKEYQHLVLVGLMGTGKSTVARILSQRLHRRLIDTDATIEARSRRTVRQIFADEGESFFRKLETEILVEALDSSPPAVIAAAGGVVLAPENRAVLKASKSRIVWLSADPALLTTRVRNAGHRPLLDQDPGGALREMAGAREALYREVAHVVVRVDGRTPAEVADAILR